MLVKTVNCTGIPSYPSQNVSRSEDKYNGDKDWTRESLTTAGRNAEQVHLCGNQDNLCFLYFFHALPMKMFKKITGSNLMEREKYLWGHRDQVLLNKGSWWLTHHYLLTQNPSAWIRHRQRQNNGEMYPLFPLSPTDLVFKVWKCVNIKNNSSISTWSDPEHHTCSEAMSFFRLSLDPF